MVKRTTRLQGSKKKKDDIYSWMDLGINFFLNNIRPEYHNILDSGMRYTLHEQACQMLPYLEQAAIDAEKDLGDVVLTVSKRVKKMDLYKKISAFSKKVASKFHKMWEVRSESETSEEKQSEKENT